MKTTNFVSRTSRIRFNILKSYFVFFIFFIATVSCTNKKQVIIPEIEFLKARDSISYPDKCYYSAMIYDSLLVLTTDCDSNYFHIFNKNTLKPILSFGTKGKGPTDFSTPLPFKTNSLMEAPFTNIDYYNANSPVISSINFPNIINKIELSSCIKSNTIDEDLFMNIELNKISDYEIAGIDIGRSNGLFYIYNSKTKTKNWIDFSPGLKSFDERLSSVIYAGSLCSNNKVLVFANKFFDEISFYSADGELLKKYNFAGGREPEINSEDMFIEATSQIYFTKSYATSQYYYVFRLNNTIEAVRKTTLLPSSLFVFDWQSNLLKNYGLRSLPVCFCIDESTKLLYTIEKTNPGEGQISIKTYDLN